MQRKEFENRIKSLLPKAADDVVTVPLRRRSLQNAMAWNLFMRYEIENI